jgi:hypothetical protein
MPTHPSASRRPLAWLAAAALGVFLLSAPAESLGAQEQVQQVLSPSVLPDNAPIAKPARALAALALAGDEKALEEWLRANATAAYVSSERFKGDVARAVATLKEGARTIIRLDDVGPGRVGVVLAASDIGEPERALLVLFEPAAPHRVTGIGFARLTSGG